jgi:DNA polymerase-3 subunit delta
MVVPSQASIAKFLARPPEAIRGFLIYGSDDAQISSRADTLSALLLKKSPPDSQLIRLHDGDLTGDPDRIVVELSTVSLFGGTKILRLTSFPTKAQQVVLDVAAQGFADSYLIVQAPGLKKTHKAVQAFESSPTLAAVACYGESSDSIASAVIRQAAEAGYEIAQDAAALIAARSDFSALIARTETEKIITFAGEARRLTVDHVASCLADQETAGLSDIVNHALNGEAAKAIQAFGRFMATEQNAVPVLTVLSTTLLRLHSLRSAVDQGQPVAQSIKELRPPVFFKEHDALAAQVRRWSKDRIADKLRRLNAITKETRLNPLLAEDMVEALLLEIAQAAKTTSATAHPGSR